METEKQFKEIFGKMSHDQLLDYAYKLRTEVETLQEKNSSLKRAMYGRKKENVNIDQLSLFNEAELVDESSEPDEVKDVDIPEDTASGKNVERTEISRQSEKRLLILPWIIQYVISVVENWLKSNRR